MVCTTPARRALGSLDANTSTKRLASVKGSNIPSKMLEVMAIKSSLPAVVAMEIPTVTEACVAVGKRHYEEVETDGISYIGSKRAKTAVDVLGEEKIGRVYVDEPAVQVRVVELLEEERNTDILLKQVESRASSVSTSPNSSFTSSQANLDDSQQTVLTEPTVSPGSITSSFVAAPTQSRVASNQETLEVSLCTW